ncbi:hypothetical protein AMAG_09280 [Allomyces macrogynus ATCC 38327]|uniref:protein-tyrosine-phosphatase n=1 Tax=Allomyces macrogynus (strain ATCC 38327) TaxID=578462 RepID=A0A0L0SP04_ALLM3|nr:hypothetical protein AMAG_09280 [Allomyces macrogynus ATCC 38327]|eukprot:KNE64243.1 hypothetical protein AMAG_09280 [Allomyces macrogynus ATCC 38327]
MSLLQRRRTARSLSLSVPAPSAAALLHDPTDRPSIAAAVDPALAGATEIQPGLYLGSVQSVDPFLAAHAGNAAVLNVAQELTLGPYTAPPPVASMHLPLSHAPDLHLVVRDANAFIADHRARGRAVLVHCMCGVARSAALVIAYMMAEDQMPLVRAYALVKHKRAIAPNVHLVAQLVELAREWGVPSELGSAMVTPTDVDRDMLPPGPPPTPGLQLAVVAPAIAAAMAGPDAFPTAADPGTPRSSGFVVAVVPPTPTCTEHSVAPGRARANSAPVLPLPRLDMDGDVAMADRPTTAPMPPAANATDRTRTQSAASTSALTTTPPHMFPTPASSTSASTTVSPPTLAPAPRTRSPRANALAPLPPPPPPVTRGRSGPAKLVLGTAPRTSTTPPAADAVLGTVRKPSLASRRPARRPPVVLHELKDVVRDAVLRQTAVPPPVSPVSPAAGWPLPPTGLGTDMWRPPVSARPEAFVQPAWAVGPGADDDDDSDLVVGPPSAPVAGGEERI